MGFLESFASRIIKKEIEGYKAQGAENLQNQNNLLERLAELEVALEDVGWTKVLYGSGDQEFSRAALKNISYLSRLMYLKNPLINRGVCVKRNYVWGQGVNIKVKDPEINSVIQQFLKDRKNKQEFTGHTAQMTKEADLECDGNIFLVLFVDKLKSGRVQLRSIPFAQVVEIITNPEDAKDVWYYQREWIDTKGKSQKALYPDYCYLPTKDKLTGLNGIEIKWDQPIMSIRNTPFSDWKWGVSEVYSALDWARAYKEFLEDWATITRAYARFAWKAATKGGQKQRAAIKTKLQTKDTDGNITTPAPTVGSAWIQSDNVDLTPMKTAGATTTPADGRRVLLMVSAAFGLPETFFGDVSVGTLATATSLDRPTELTMLDRQTFWKDIMQDILNYVLVQAIKAKALKGKATLEKVEDSIEQLKWNDVQFQDAVEINFPPILVGDKTANVGAVVSAITLDNGVPAGIIDEDTSTRLILTALGETNIEQVMEQMKQNKMELTQVVEAFGKKYFKPKK